MKFTTIEEATRNWVREFNAFPQGMLDKFSNEFYEVTKASIGDRVYAYNEDECYGQITEIKDNKVEDRIVYVIELDDGEIIEKEANDFEVERDGFFPMWGTMWSFGDNADDYWLEELGGIKIMSDCGFRIYEHEEFGYFFGIDGCGYDFYEAHWIPLYKARGLQWHDTE